MCGIAGILGPGAGSKVDALRRMVAALQHRGPDAEGVHVASGGRCALGFRRLAILDLTPAGNQPMLSPDGRFALVYNGECYNFHELARGLKAETLTSTGDTAVVLATLARQAERALPRMNGMFALALWDEKEQSLLLARDRLGQKPLYWTCVGDHLLFASEVRALLASGEVDRHLHWPALVGYLSNGGVQGDETLVSGVRLLPRASFLRIEAGRAPGAPEAYWQPSTAKSDSSPMELGVAFGHAVERHLISDAPLGIFLSGGVDSTAVAAAAARRAGSAVETLSVVFPEAQDDPDREYSRRMAARIESRHHEIELPLAEAARMTSGALAAMDQPTFDGVNTYIVSHAARQAGLKVALSGLGGDELFGGYPAFRDVPRMMRIRSALGAVRHPAAGLLKLSGRTGRIGGKLADLMECPGGALDSYLVRRRLFSSSEISALIPSLRGDGWLSGQSRRRHRQLEEIVAKREIHDAVSLLELDVYMGQILLRDSDVMGMAHGLEIRLPFLDADFVERSLALDSLARRPSGTPKRRFVEAMGDLIPAEIRERRKRGFALPFEEWMLGPLRDQVADGLEWLGRSSGLWHAPSIAALWSRFLADPGGIGHNKPWALFAIARYLREHRLSL